MASLSRKRERNSVGTFLNDENQPSEFYQFKNGEDTLTLRGKIKCVDLKDFLNHKTLLYKPTPRVNLIVGRNGSGKSAIAQAISLGCGIKAAKAGREGYKLKSYIRNSHLDSGPSSAIIKLTFYNEGDEGISSYRPEEFGDEIILKRIIRLSSSSEWSLTGNRPGARIYTSRKSIEDFLDFFNLDVSNPVVYLSQDSAKTLFTSSRGKEFFNFFAGCSALTKTLETMKEEEKKLEECEEIFRKETFECERRLQEFHQWKEKFDACVNLRHDRQRRRILAAAHEMKKVQAKEEEKDVAEGKIKELEEQLQQTEGNEPLLLNIEMLDREKNRVQSDFSDITRRLEECKIRKQTLLREAKRQCRNIQMKKNHMQEIEAKLASLGEEKLELESKKEGNALSEARRTLTSCQQNFDSINERLNKDGEELDRLQKYNEDCGGEHRRIKAELESKVAEFTSLQEQFREGKLKLKSLQSNDRNLRQIYGYDVVEMRKELDGKKKSDILGPVCEYIRVAKEFENNPKVISCLERHLSSVRENIFATWIVDNREDQTLVEGLLKKYRARAKVTCVFNIDRSPFNIEPFCTSAAGLNCLVLLKGITCAKPEILRFLIDQGALHSTALFNSYEELHSCLLDERSSFSGGYSLIPDRAFWEVLSATRRGAGIYSYPSISISANWKFLIVDTGAESEHLNASLSLVKNQISLISEEKRALMKDEAEKKRLLHEGRLKVKQVVDRLRIQERDRKNAQEKFEEANAEVANEEAILMDEDDIANELREKDEEIAKLRSEIAELSAEINNLNEEVFHTTEIKKIDEEGQNLITEKESLLKKFNNLEEKKTEYRDAYEKWRQEVHMFQSVLSIAKDELEKKKAEVELSIWKLDNFLVENHLEVDECREARNEANAHSFGRLAETLVALEAKVLKAARLFERQQNVNIELVEGIYKEKEAEYYTFLEEYKSFSKSKEMERKSYKMALDDLSEKVFKAKIKAEFAFQTHVDQTSGYVGTMNIDPVGKSIDFVVQNRQQTSKLEHATTDLKGLSGGEKSTIQMAFLSAMAQVSESPLHMFDEMDVYMDVVTLCNNVQRMMEFAQNTPDRQLFFLSPQLSIKEVVKGKFPDVLQILEL